MRRRTATLLILAAAACLAGGACDKKKADAEPKGGVAQPKAAKAPIFVDDKQVGAIDAGKAASFPPLGALLPAAQADPAGWKSISLQLSGGDKRVVIDDPGKSHPGLVAGVYAAKGGVAFGFFAPEDLAKKGKPQAEWLSVLEIRVTSGGMEAGGGAGDGGGGGGEQDSGERPAPSKDLVIKIKSADGETTFTGDKLTSVATSTAPIGDMDTPGWTLPAVIEAAGVKVPAGAKVIVYGDEGANLVLEPGDLDPAKATLFIKLNRQGKLRFRVFRKIGTTWEVGGELRGIASVELK